MTDENEPEQPAPLHMRSFSLNSGEFYEAVTEPRPSWCWGPGVPPDPPSWLPRTVSGVLWLPSNDTDYAI